MNVDLPIESLRNLGPTSGQWLREAGIATVADLEWLGIWSRRGRVIEVLLKTPLSASHNSAVRSGLAVRTSFPSGLKVAAPTRVWCCKRAVVGHVAIEQPGLDDALEGLVDSGTCGDPMSPLRWTCKSTRDLARELTRQGFTASCNTVGRLLRARGYSLQANRKTLEGKQHPDRDAQFRHIGRRVSAFRRRE